VIHVPRRPVRPSWIGVQGPCSCARFRGKALNVETTGHAVVAHPTGVRLGKIVRTGPGSSSRVSGARLPLMRVSGQGPECRCNGTYRCRVSNRRTVGEDRKNRAGFFVGWDATGGRMRRPCQACCATTHRLPNYFFSYFFRHLRLSVVPHTYRADPSRFTDSASTFFVAIRSTKLSSRYGTSCHARGRALSRSLRIFSQGNFEIGSSTDSKCVPLSAFKRLPQNSTDEDNHETANTE